MAAINTPANLESSVGATGLEKVSFHSNLKEGQCQRMLKLHHTHVHFTASKVMFKIFQARLQQYVKPELPDVQSKGFKKAEEPEIKLPNFIESWKKQRNSRKK